MLDRSRRTLGFALATSLWLGLSACAPEPPDSSNPWEETSEEDGALRVCSAGPTVQGVDVSYYQEKIDWSAVAKTNVKFAIVRVSDGEVFADPRFAANWKGAKAAGLVRGTYQFFRPSQDPVKQADLVIDALASDPLGEGDLPVVLDVETSDGVSNATLRARMKKWLVRVEAATGKRPIVYTAAFMQNVVGGGFSDYPLWVANYTSDCPLVPSGWTGWRMWQYSDHGKVSGIPGSVDRDVWNGTLDDLLAFAGKAASPSEPPPHADDPPAPAGGAPTGLVPKDGAHEDGPSVTMGVDPFDGATGYEFEIEYFQKSSGAWTPYYGYSTTKPMKTFWPALDAGFRFRVRATAPGGDSPSSPWSSFAFGSASLPAE
ncbi:MAG: GH25 family lysozyme [Polyangiaceae bacterium]